MGWAKAKFGLKPTSAYHLWCLHHALNEHRKRSVEAATISLFLEMPPNGRSVRALCFYLHVRAYVSGDVQRITLPGAPPHKPGGSPSFHNGSPSPLRPSSAARPNARLPRGEGGGSSPELRGGKHGGASSSGGRGGGGGEAHERHVIVLARAWDAAQHLFRPAPAHIRMAMLRELQAGSLPVRQTVPPELRASNPLELLVVDLDFFLLAAVVFYDLSTQPSVTGQAGQFGKQLGKLDHPMAVALLAVLRRSLVIDSGAHSGAHSGAPAPGSGVRAPPASPPPTDYEVQDAWMHSEL